jgi:ornithine cyclodeaminase/alanine dehydrogenase-like protein (mu-crystallin family)
MGSMLILNREDVRQALTMREAIPVVKEAFVQLSTGQADAPLRGAIRPARRDGVALVMPGYLSGTDALAVKVVTVFPGNRAAHLPTIHALVLLLNAATGEPLAVMEGGGLTALRTGAASGVATDLLAREDARIAAIFGAGAQARTQLLAVCAARDLRRVWVYAPNPDRTHELIAELQPLVDATELLAARSPAQATQEADVICAATTSHTPVFDGALVKPGAHINAVGSFTPEMQEVDCVTLQRAAKIVIDSRQGALAEAGDLLIALRQGAIRTNDIYGEIGEIAAGLKPGRARADEITYFKTVGNAALDVAVAQAVYQKSLEDGLGTEVFL